MSVRPSVCLSRSGILWKLETAQHIVIVSSPHGSTIILILREIRTGSPLMGTLNTGYKIFAIFDSNSLYLANDTR